MELIGLNINLFFMLSFYFCVGEKMPTEVVRYFDNYLLLSETIYEDSALCEIEDFINTVCTRDIIEIEKFSYTPVNTRDSNGIVLSFDFAILNISYSFRSNPTIGYNSVFIINENYLIKDELTVLRYVKPNEHKVLYLSEIFYLNNKNFVSIRNYDLENQDYHMHPYLTRVDTMLQVKINTLNLNFMK